MKVKACSGNVCIFGSRLWNFVATCANLSALAFSSVHTGRVIMGMEVFRQMSEVDTLNQRPTTDCKISKCGQMTPAEFATIACK